MALESGIRIMKMGRRRMFSARRSSGVTLMELIIVITVILILMGGAVPVVRVSIKRARETELRRDLWEMRSAIDHYKDAADKNAFQQKLDSQGYPPLPAAHPRRSHDRGQRLGHALHARRPHVRHLGRAECV